MGSIYESTDNGVRGERVTAEMIQTQVLHCPATEALRQHSAEFEKKIYTVTEGVHVAVGYALANSILLEAPEGVIVVDTTESIPAMKEVWQEFRKISDKPLRGIIYTHSHEDHVGGTPAIITEEDEHNIEIWAHDKFRAIKDTYDSLLRGVMLPRNLRQFGVPLQAMGALMNCGIGPFAHPGYKADSHLVWPNRFMESEKTLDISIAGLDLQLVYIPGETLCQMGIWIPSKRVFLPGDNFYKAFPNLYAIRGTVPRIVTRWVDSLDIMRQLRPAYLVPSHGRPLTGEENIYGNLTCYRDAIQFVHDQTLRLMNRGLHPVEVARSIQLPDSLQKVPYLHSFYGTPEWSSRAIYDAYVGWFSGSPEELFPLTPKQRANNMVDAFGADTVLKRAEEAMEKEEHQWALELSSHVLLTDARSQQAQDIRTRAILKMASQQISANGRNYFLTCLLEDHGVHPKRFPSANAVLEKPVEFVLKRMAFEIKAEKLEDVVISTTFTFTDIERTFALNVRNCVLSFEETSTSDAELNVRLTVESLRQVVAGHISPRRLLATGDLAVEGSQSRLLDFFGCFELGDEFTKPEDAMETC